MIKDCFYRVLFEIVSELKTFPEGWDGLADFHSKPTKFSGEFLREAMVVNRATQSLGSEARQSSMTLDEIKEHLTNSAQTETAEVIQDSLREISDRFESPDELLVGMLGTTVGNDVQN